MLSVTVNARSKYFYVTGKKGYIFFKQNCNSCHTEPFFNNCGFLNNGLSVDNVLVDYARMKVTKYSADSIKFKLPTLRNIEFTHLYMHDDRFKNCVM